MQVDPSNHVNPVRLYVFFLLRGLRGKKFELFKKPSDFCRVLPDASALSGQAVLYAGHPPQ